MTTSTIKKKKILTDKEKLEISHKNFDNLYKSFVEEKEKLELKIKQGQLSQMEDEIKFLKSIDKNPMKIFTRMERKIRELNKKIEELNKTQILLCHKWKNTIERLD